MTAVSIPDNVVFEHLNDEMIVLEMESGIYYRLNATGARTWRLLETSASIEEASMALAEEFNIPRERAQRDVELFIDHLLGLSLVERA